MVTPLALEAFQRGFFEKLAELHWTSDPSAQRHAKKHSGQMYLTPEKYLEEAQKMYAQRADFKQVRDKKHKGANVYWDTATGKKLVVTPDGRIVSFYNAGTRP